MAVEIPARQLSTREQVIARLLAPLRKEHVPCQFYAHKRGGGKVVAAHAGDAPDSDYRTWSFRTFAPRLRCRYFELWKPAQGDSVWYLDRAYLTLFKIGDHPTDKEQELVLLHCDPCDDSEIKRGPHVHFEATPEEHLRRAHFPLNREHLEQVLQSSDSLTGAFRSAIEIVVAEIVERYGGMPASNRYPGAFRSS
jgi:hypothetical protein